jgi:nicotinamidase-related amidase
VALTSVPSSDAAIDRDPGASAIVPASAAKVRTGGRTAVLLLDLQVDFLDAERGKMPVARDAGRRVVDAANRVLAGTMLAGALPVLIVNRFPRTAPLANLARRGAAVAGTPGAELDPRIATPRSVRLFAKERSSAFSNPALEPFLRSEGIATIWIVGVMSEACVRATALAARRLGFAVAVAEEGIATRAPWKARLGAWLLRRGGVAVVRQLPAMVGASA